MYRVTIFVCLSIVVSTQCYRLKRTSEAEIHRDHSAIEGSKPRENLTEDLFKDYNGRVPPTVVTGHPVHVQIQLHILSIDTVSETNMDFSMSMIVRQTWNDSRLAYDPVPGFTLLELDSILMNKVWIPDLYFPSEKKAEFHTVTVPNKLMHIYPYGMIMYSQRISATMKCNFDLQKYPMDSQHCEIEMESFGYTTDTLEFLWNENDPVIKKEDLRIPKYSLGEITTSRCDKTYVKVPYTCVKVIIHFDRSMGYYLIQVYIPSILIVILSWVSFWLDPEAVPARISLGLLTVLTMTTQSSSARASLPKVSYVKSIDIWMVVCLIFVFVALVQFAYVNVLSRAEKKRKQVDMIAVGCSPILESSKEEEIPKRSLPVRQGVLSSKLQTARTLDKISRVVFPAVFIIFNCIYWSVYLLWVPATH